MDKNRIAKVLTIAGSDCSGGAGIQADLKTMMAYNVYGMSVVTSVTAQNTTAVYEIVDLSPDFIGKQLDAVFNDIYPDAVKIGMVSNLEIIKVIVSKLNEYKPENIVIDPVIVSTSGKRLLTINSEFILINELLPLAKVITPNIFEAEVISGMKISGKNDMLMAGKKIVKLLQKNVLLKGGHLTDCADDLLYDNKGRYFWFSNDRINNENTHGTGCTLSSAIACSLAKGESLYNAIYSAKIYVTNVLKANLNLGSGVGPLNHCVRVD